MKAHFSAFALCAFVLSGIAAAACGGGGGETPPPAAPPTASASEAASTPAASAGPPASAAAAASGAAPAASAAAPSGPPKAGEWDTWSKDQKLEYMKAAVMPKLGGMFHDFDGTRYAEPKCVLCHGAGVKDGSFKMPNPDLPKLDITPAGFAALKAKKPKVVDFMIQVEHTTADLLGEQPFDPKTMKGFGCLNCHTKK
jgi:hypothetical protein